jgi:hypothetical protein
MANDLERRRRAIADALREIMAEPLPVLQSAPMVAPLEAVEPIPQPSMAAADRVVTEEWDTAELTERGEAMVPPLESVGSMSRTASLALFGHA